VRRVLAAYERARQWILAHPDDAAQILAGEAKIALPVAKRELVDRTVLTGSPIPGAAQAAVLHEIIPILVSEQQVKPGTDVDASLKALFAPQFIQAVAQQ
jgi:sulfonate transport system substrate-binding protein